MNLEALFQELRVMDHLLAVLLGMPRLFMIIQTVPFMGGTIVTGQIRVAVAFACYMFIHPMVLNQLDVPQVLTVAVMGGLALSTFITLILVPVLYRVVETRLRRKPRFAESKGGTGA